MLSQYHKIHSLYAVDSSEVISSFVSHSDSCKVVLEAVPFNCHCPTSLSSTVLDHARFWGLLLYTSAAQPQRTLTVGGGGSKKLIIPPHYSRVENFNSLKGEEGEKIN